MKNELIFTYGSNGFSKAVCMMGKHKSVSINSIITKNEVSKLTGIKSKDIRQYSGAFRFSDKTGIIKWCKYRLAILVNDSIYFFYKESFHNVVFSEYNGLARVYKFNNDKSSRFHWERMTKSSIKLPDSNPL